MQFTSKVSDLLKEKCDTLVVDVFFKEKLSGEAAIVDKALGGLLTRVMQEEGFEGKLGQTLFVRADKAGVSPKRFMVMGLGEKAHADQESVRCASASAFELARDKKSKRLAYLIPNLAKVDARLCGKAIAEGVSLVAYTFGRYKKTDKNSVKDIVLISKDSRRVKAAAAGLETGELYAQAANYARDLVNTPGRHMKPHDLVAAAQEIAKGGKGIRIRVYDKAALKRMGAGGILGVGQGSDHEPFLVHMIYKPPTTLKALTPPKPLRKIALVGKAITFDSGGLSLKPADYMTNMKIDMAGAADVLAVFKVIRQVAPRVEVHGIFAPCENMPSGKAILPGDVVEIMNGKTIEILNTDAEGRVTLADSLVYAVKQKPDAIVDLATLTGACMVALGEEITGLMGNNAKLSQSVLRAAAAEGEKMWELPLEKSYKKQIKSDVADYKNIADRYGGALTAGLLLEEFVDKKPWVHLDIAGPAYAEKPLNQYTKKGATGHGVRTLLEFLKSF